jgi:hypothetical protein
MVKDPKYYNMPPGGDPDGALPDKGIETGFGAGKADMKRGYLKDPHEDTTSGAADQRSGGRPGTIR